MTKHERMTFLMCRQPVDRVSFMHTRSFTTAAAADIFRPHSCTFKGERTFLHFFFFCSAPQFPIIKNVCCELILKH